ncbi:hypothetical protein F4553_002000 [Allocatelliglobosispora scoriae]|uniref:Trypsin-co-occurring domain-containing protein n=1 Tax=Allocatelliglobosispora scoriae TaxID=643052 RepID=A0A841BP66_9ACTN|nr:CU044_2847 family protein [Allocatelliglobosispora scoriae]MBB5868621.1 hypothetical protein [Allocatelliglobosispora scoriae]
MAGARSEIVEVELPDGTRILAEVTVPAQSDVGARPRLFHAEALGGQISSVSSWILSHVREGLPDRPSQISVEFGLKLGVKSGQLVSILAEGTGEASVVVKLDWPLASADPAVPAS